VKHPHGPRVAWFGAKWQICFIHRVLDFHFFPIFSQYMILRDAIFNVVAQIWH
jgi:hypothetical protein